MYLYLGTEERGFLCPSNQMKNATCQKNPGNFKSTLYFKNLMEQNTEFTSPVLTVKIVFILYIYNFFFFFFCNLQISFKTG